MDVLIANSKTYKLKDSNTHSLSFLCCISAVDMISNIQKAVINSKLSLPFAGVLAFVCWWLNADMGTGYVVTNEGYGWLWSIVPSELITGLTGLGIGALMSAVAVYLLMELNNANVMLRAGSRMMGLLLTVFFAVSFSVHVFSVGHIVGVLALLAYFFLFASYQNGGRGFVYVEFMCISLATLFFPAFIFLVPLYWVALAMIRSFDMKSLCASVLGLLTPYWFVVCYAVLAERLDVFSEHIGMLMEFELFDYSSLSLHQIIVVVLALVMFVAGGIEFRVHSFLDKTRIRILYDTVLILGSGSFVLLAFLPGYYSALLPIILVNASIVSGHHLAQCFGKVMNVYTILLILVFLVLGIGG